MVLNNIEKLIEKYDNAETTLKEEAQLRAYFLSDDVAPHLEHYRPLFLYFSQAKSEEFTKDVPLKRTKTIQLYRWISVAAVLILMFSIVLPIINEPQPKDALAGLTDEEIQEYYQAKDALAMMFGKFNEGTKSLTTLSDASSSWNSGISRTNQITQFNTTINKLVKN